MSAKRSEDKRETPANRSARNLLLSCVPEIILTAVVVLLVGCGSCLAGLAEYLGGLHGAGVGWGFALAGGLKSLTVLIVLAVVVPTTMIRLLIRRRTPGERLLRLAFLAVCLVALLIPLEAPEAMAAIYLRGFERRMLKKVDLDAVQQWLANEGVKYAGREYRPGFPPELPRCLTEFQPSIILFSGATLEHGVSIEFRWYAPHGENLGLIVGPPAIKTPAEGAVRLPNSPFNEFRRPIKPGAYVFARG